MLNVNIVLKQLGIMDGDANIRQVTVYIPSSTKYSFIAAKNRL